MRSLLPAVAALIAVTSISSVSYAQATAPFNVRSYGATGACNLAADTGGLLAAIAAVPASGGEIYLPAGTYCVNQTLAVTGKPIAFRGEGQRISNIVWYGGVNNGIEFTSTVAAGITHQTLSVRSLSLLRHDGSSGAAIYAHWPVYSVPLGHGNGGGVTTTIEDVHISSDPWPSSTGAYWYFGIQLFNTTLSKIGSFTIQGPSAGGGISAIQLASDPVDLTGHGGRSVAVYLHDGFITQYVRGVESKDLSEGLQAHNITIKEVLWGFQLANPGPGTAISNCDILAKWRGITLYNAGDIAITGNQITQFQDDVATGFLGIEANADRGAAGRIRIIGNSVTSPPGTTSGRNGIYFVNGITDSVIQGNSTQNQNYGIVLANATVANSIVIGNLNRAFTIAGILNVGTGNYVVHNP